jgi:hypothetical protein
MIYVKRVRALRMSVFLEHLTKRRLFFVIPVQMEIHEHVIASAAKKLNYSIVNRKSISLSRLKPPQPSTC